jgi:hypothetical protein
MDKNLKRVKIFDHNFAHAKYSTDFQESKYIVWDRNKSVGENEPIFYTDIFLKSANGNPKNKHAILLEPPSINPNIYNFANNNNHLFETIFTYDKDLIDKGENYKFYPHGGCWIHPYEQKIYEKTKNCSIIASNKTTTKGHKLRHEVIKQFNDKMDVYGGGYNPIKNKITALSEYRFSVTIENIKKDYYFTEKIIDCFMTGTIPIYYGCPSISKFFDIDGIITFDNIDDLKGIMNNLDEEFYNNKIKSIENNFNEAKKYLIAEDWIYENTEIL